LDATLLLASVLKTTREKLILRDADSLDHDAVAEFGRLLDRRCEGECVAYILGFKEFRGLDFMVSPDVLVPRPDTETLVEAALAALPLAEETVRPPALLDLCTGSGAVAIALKHERPFLDVYATDISSKALGVARKNAARLLPRPDAGALRFLEGDLFEPVPPVRFDLITANPPYVPSSEIPNLPREVRFEPLMALDGGEDGLDLARRIVEDAPAFLKAGGRLLMEADSGQMPLLALILEEKGYRDVRIHQDLSGLARVIEGIAAPG
jgi:release factor glutamine methyltransferase